MSKMIPIEASAVINAGLATAEDLPTGSVVRLYITKNSRGPKGEKKIRQFQGSGPNGLTACDDRKVADNGYLATLGDTVSYEGEMATVSLVRRTWVEIHKEDDSYLWTRRGHLELIKSNAPAKAEEKEAVTA